MKKGLLIINFLAFVLVMLSLLITSSSFIELGKYFLVLVLGLMLFGITNADKRTSVHHTFNILFMMATIVFVTYSIALKSALYNELTLLFALAALIGLILSLSYKGAKKFTAPKHPVKKVAAKKVVRKTTRKAQSNKVTGAQKRQVSRVVAKKATSKPKTKVSGTSRSRNAKQISFNKDYEVAYVLRKYNKRITKDNKEILIAHGKRFKKNTRYKPHDREKFYSYVKTYKVLSKLQ